MSDEPRKIQHAVGCMWHAGEACTMLCKYGPDAPCVGEFPRHQHPNGEWCTRGCTGPSHEFNQHRTTYDEPREIFDASAHLAKIPMIPSDEPREELCLHGNRVAFCTHACFAGKCDNDCGVIGCRNRDHYDALKINALASNEPPRLSKEGE